MENISNLFSPAKCATFFPFYILMEGFAVRHCFLLVSSSTVNNVLLNVPDVESMVVVLALFNRMIDHLLYILVFVHE